MYIASRYCAALFLLVPQVVGDDAPPADIYFRRKGHNIVVVGDYLYVHGGEISWDSGNGLPVGQSGDADKPNDGGSNRVNGTLSLPLAESWSNDTIPWIRTPNISFAPSLVRPALWPYGDTFYAWGGYTRYGHIDPTQLWKFTANGVGGGEWAPSQPDDGSVDSAAGLVGSAAAARAACKGVGLYLSGFGSDQTDRTFKGGADDRIPVPGILTYDFETAIWSNKSTKPGLNEYGTSAYASATCLDGYGGKGVFLTIMGELIPNPFRYNDDGLSQVETSTVSLYDVGADRWLKQTIFGEAPPRRDRTCIATARNENGSFDIYMYGGLQWRVGEQNKVYNDIWILSIPAFTWFKLDVVGTLRCWHECVIVGSQLISVGGSGIDPWRFDYRDEWRQGIGVLDLTTMTWADRYSPNSTAYQSPQMVKDWYRDKYGEECDEVKALFTNSTADSPNTIAPQPSSQKNHLGSIVGGAVAGSVALLATNGTAIWYLRRRRNKTNQPATAIKAQNEEVSDNANPHSEIMSQSYLTELNGRPGLFQLEGRQKPAELHHGQDIYTPTGLMHTPEVSELADSSPVTQK